MNICFLCSGFGVAQGGAQKQLTKLIRILAKKNCRMTILARKSFTSGNVAGADIVLIHDYFFGLRIPGNLLFIFGAVLWIFRHRAKIDVIHCIMMYSHTIAGVIAKWLTGIPVVTKVTLTNETGEVDNIQKLPFFRIRRKMLNSVDRFIAITTQAEKELLTLGLSEDKISFIPNGVVIGEKFAFKDEDRHAAKKKLGLSDGPIMLYMGRFASEKNIDIILEAMLELRREDQLCNLKLILLGSGSRWRSVEKQLRDFVTANGLSPHVDFLPPVYEVYDYLVASDIFLLLSSTEGLSNSLLEAMACGCNIIATDIDANRDLLKNGENACLVPVRDVVATSKAIKKFLNSGYISHNSGKKALEVIKKNYAMEEIANRHFELYKELVLSH